MSLKDFLRRIPVFVVVYAVIGALSPTDPLYLGAGPLQPLLWASVILAVWLGLWSTLICTSGMAALILLARARQVDPLEAETLLTVQDWIVPLSMVLVSSVIGYLADRLRDSAQVERQRVAGAESSLAELGRLNESVSHARRLLEQEIQTLTRTPAQIAAIAERFEVDSEAELLRNLLKVTTEHVRSRAVALYRYDTFSRWSLVDSRAGSISAPFPAFAEFFEDQALGAEEREGLLQLLRAGAAAGSSVGWADGQVVRPGDLVLPLSSGAAGGFAGILIHRDVSFADTSPSVRATLEALTRWASLILKRRARARQEARA